MVFLGNIILALNTFDRKKGKTRPIKFVKAVMWWVLANRIGLEDSSMDKNVKTFLGGHQRPGVIKRANALADKCMLKRLKAC